jgi:hypothetical protein
MAVSLATLLVAALLSALLVVPNATLVSAFLAVKPYGGVLLVQVAAPAVVAVLWYRHCPHAAAVEGPTRARGTE